MSPRRLSSANLTTIIVAVVGVIGVIATAYFSFRGNTASVELPLKATQTAQAQITLTHVDAVVIQDTPVPIATETPLPAQVMESPQPTPIVLFSESFDTNANDWALGARSGNISKQNREIVDGTLEIGIDFYENGYGWVNAPDFRAENFYVAVDAEIVQFSTRSKIGIVIAFRMTNGGNASYAIEFNNDGTIALFSTQTLREDGRWQLVHEEKSDAFQINEGMWNNFAVRVLGQRFTAYANGIELFTFEDNSIRGIGEVGIGLSGERQKSAIARFDNFVITK